MEVTTMLIIILILGIYGLVVSVLLWVALMDLRKAVGLLEPPASSVGPQSTPGASSAAVLVGRLKEREEIYRREAYQATTDTNRAYLVGQTAGTRYAIGLLEQWVDGDSD